MIGAIIGDIVGSRFEFHNIKTKDFDLWHNDCHTTDDTILTCAVADCLLHNGIVKNYLMKWGWMYKNQKYEDGKISAFSKGFTKWLDSGVAYNANTNGCIMRLSPVPLFYDNYNVGMNKAINITNTTHNHPESITATRAYIDTAYMIKKHISVDNIKEHISNKYDYDLYQSLDAARPTYNKFYCTCKNSVPFALIAALDATDFTDAIRSAVSIGGDSDTLACMAGGIAELRFGVSSELCAQSEKFMDSNMIKIVKEFYTKIKSN
jgi:ADP-ribosylglycohydrolase